MPQESRGEARARDRGPAHAGETTRPATCTEALQRHATQPYGATPAFSSTSHGPASAAAWPRASRAVVPNRLARPARWGARAARRPPGAGARSRPPGDARGARRRGSAPPRSPRVAGTRRTPRDRPGPPPLRGVALERDPRAARPAPGRRGRRPAPLGGRGHERHDPGANTRAPGARPCASHATPAPPSTQKKTPAAASTAKRAKPANPPSAMAATEPIQPRAMPARQSTVRRAAGGTTAAMRSRDQRRGEHELQPAPQHLQEPGSGGPSSGVMWRASSCPAAGRPRPTRHRPSHSTDGRTAGTGRRP